MSVTVCLHQQGMITLIHRMSAQRCLPERVQFCCVKYIAFQFVAKELTTYCTSLDGPTDQHVITHMQYTHPHLVFTCSTAPLHTYVESSCHHLHSHTLTLNLHKLTCTHTHLSSILYAVSHALSLSVTCTHSLHSLGLRYLSHRASGRRCTEGNV
jgi:hypothetical protein